VCGCPFEMSGYVGEFKLIKTDYLMCILIISVHFLLVESNYVIVSSSVGGINGCDVRDRRIGAVLGSRVRADKPEPAADRNVPIYVHIGPHRPPAPIICATLVESERNQ